MAPNSVERHYRAPSCFVLFSDNVGLSEEIAKQLRTAGNQVISVTPGEAFARTSDENYVIQAGARRIIRRCSPTWRSEAASRRNLCICGRCFVKSSSTSIEQALNFSFYSLLFLAQALGEQDLNASKSRLFPTDCKLWVKSACRNPCEPPCSDQRG